MSQFNIDEIEKRTLSGLKDFQRATVERVDYLFRHNQNRVLVADEVGMGKTLIARGAIVKTARLRIEEKDDLFKVIYICSNQNIANQNIRKLDVTGKNAIGSVSDTRLSMQHLKITEQENDPQIKEGFIQLIPLTPETSFRMTTGGGSVQERALMYAILRRMPDFKGHVTSLEKFMIMDAVKAWDGWAKWNFENRVAECEKMTKGVYPQNVIEKILNYQEYESIRDMLLNHLHERRYNKQLTYSNYYVMNKLRVMFARISVSMLEPDLVIMDEFQRFKFLLSSDDSELGILAHSFLSGHDTRVLLLSATPYKLYSTLEEIDENQLDEHYAEFFQVMNFLFDDEVKDIKFKEVWKNYSHALSELKAGVFSPKMYNSNMAYNQLSSVIADTSGMDYLNDDIAHKIILIGNFNDFIDWVPCGLHQFFLGNNKTLLSAYASDLGCMQPTLENLAGDNKARSFELWSGESIPHLTGGQIFLRQLHQPLSLGALTSVYRLALASLTTPTAGTVYTTDTGTYITLLDNCVTYALKLN